MKAVFCLALLACVAMTFGEECREVSDCTHVDCPEADYELGCVRGSCTCTHLTASCIVQEDCEDQDENCRREWHCVDGRCRCGLGFDGR